MNHNIHCDANTHKWFVVTIMMMRKRMIMMISMMMVMLMMLMMMSSGGWLDGDCHYNTAQWNCMCKKSL